MKAEELFGTGKCRWKESLFLIRLRKKDTVVSDISEDSHPGRTDTRHFSRNGSVCFVTFAVYMAKKESINRIFTGFLKITKKAWQNLWIVCYNTS